MENKVTRINKVEFIKIPGEIHEFFVSFTKQDGTFAMDEAGRQVFKLVEKKFNVNERVSVIESVEKFCENRKVSIEDLLKSENEAIFVLDLFTHMNAGGNLTKKKSCTSFNQVSTLGDAKFQIIEILKNRLLNMDQTEIVPQGAQGAIEEIPMDLDEGKGEKVVI